MNPQNQNFTEPEITTTNDLTHRSYITFYFNDERIREYNGKCIGQAINPNRAKTLMEKKFLLKKLQFEIHKALDSDNYPQAENQNDQIVEIIKTPSNNALLLLFNAVRTKLRSNLSRTYTRDLKAVYREFKAFVTNEEAKGPLENIQTYRVELFLCKYGSSGTYYMNKRRNLAVLFSAAGRSINLTIKTVKETPKRKAKARLHQKYSKEQLMPVLNFLKARNYNLYLCCLFTYGTWLRPHEEIRLLTVGSFVNDFSEVHLSGSENKGGNVRVVYVPDFIQREIKPVLSGQDNGINIFTLRNEPFNYSYFNTQWSRAYKNLYEKGLVYKNQTIYSFRHTAAVSLYKRKKDVYLLQKLLGHSSIVVTLKYLRTLGEVTTDELREAAPSLD